MANYTLKAAAPVVNYVCHADGMSVKEMPSANIYSLAVYAEGEKKLNTVLKKSFGVELPSAGKQNSNGSNKVFSTANSQWFLDVPSPLSDKLLSDLSERAALTDQSDSWVDVRLSGPKVLIHLERICPIDLHEDHFPVGSVARTMMEHIAVIFIRDEDTDKGESSYRILAAQSYKKSVFHMVNYGPAKK